MARRVLTRKDAPRRDDWVVIEQFELTDGSAAVKWSNLVSGEQATLRPGVHPLDNPNSINNALAVVEEHEPEDQALTEPEPPETPADRVAVLLSGYQPGSARAEVKIYRLKDDGSEVYCGGLRPEEFEEKGYEYIGANHGAGRYRVTLYATDPRTNKFVRRATETLEIERPKTGDPSNPLNAIAPVLDKLAQRLDSIENTRRNPMEEMQSMLLLMKTMKDALGLSDAPKQAQTPAQTIKEIADVMGLMKQMRDEIDPPPQDTSLAGVGLEALKVIGNIVSNPQGQGSPQAGAIPTLAIPAQIAAPQSIQPHEQTMPNDSPEVLAFKEAIQSLNTAARFGIEPGIAAEQVYEKAPDEVIELLKRPDWFDQIKALAPTVAEFEAWYRGVHAAVMEILKEEGTSDESAST